MSIKLYHKRFHIALEMKRGSLYTNSVRCSSHSAVIGSGVVTSFTIDTAENEVKGHGHLGVIQNGEIRKYCIMFPLSLCIQINEGEI